MTHSRESPGNLNPETMQTPCSTARNEGFAVQGFLAQPRVEGRGSRVSGADTSAVADGTSAQAKGRLVTNSDTSLEK